MKTFDWLLKDTFASRTMPLCQRFARSTVSRSFTAIPVLLFALFWIGERHFGG